MSALLSPPAGAFVIGGDPIPRIAIRGYNLSPAARVHGNGGRMNAATTNWATEQLPRAPPAEIPRIAIRGYPPYGGLRRFTATPAA